MQLHAGCQQENFTVLYHGYITITLIEGNNVKYLIGCLLVLLLTENARADLSSAQQAEVEHLLSFVRTSTCLINRNGTTHRGEDATAHIQKKYDYFRGKIKTTEQFIEYSATKSTMSGSYYTVLCGGQEAVRTKDWLLEELEDYRAKQRNTPYLAGGARRNSNEDTQ